MSNVKCVYCGKEFVARSDAKYCSFACQNRSRYKDATCKNCGKVFRKCGKDSTCCSISCSKQYLWKSKPAHESLPVIRSDKYHCRFIETSCKNCGKIVNIRHGDYNRTMKTRGYVTCSRHCSFVLSGKTVKLTCSECGKEFYRAISGIDPNNKHYFCSKPCQKANTDYILSGEDHYRYIDGNTSYKRGDNWLMVRREVRKRDNKTCQICGITEAETHKLHDVHHIIPYRKFTDYREANNIENLITLCSSCHHRTEATSVK
jgi:endogenous inhibitor of DNA gyrase (YacG/DUF329 family)